MRYFPPIKHIIKIFPSIGSYVVISQLKPSPLYYTSPKLKKMLKQKFYLKIGYRTRKKIKY